MDEPTATLTDQEIVRLFSVIRGLTARGIAVFYISHRLDEIFKIADRVTVMRDGKVVTTLPRSELDQQKLIRLMVGRDIHQLYPKPEPKIGPVMLRAEGITRRGILHQCSFEVRAGEILGFAGLIGSGRTELARAVFGADPIDAGSIWLEGKRLSIKSPASAIAAGIGYLTPEAVHTGHAPYRHDARQQILQVAYAAHPERFVRQCPIPPPLPTAAWINPPTITGEQEVAH